MFGWRKVSDGGMPSGWIVEAFDEVEDRDPGLGVRAEAVPVVQFAFTHGVVAGVAHRTCRGPHAGLRASAAEGRQGIRQGIKVYCEPRSKW